MPLASLERTVRFRAAHRYGRPDWSDERNREAFGPQVRSHEHDWALTVTVRGAIDDATGFVVDLAALDALLRAEVEAFDGGDLNRAVPEVRAGALQPSTEALARWLFERLAPRIPGDATLVKLRLAESDELAAEYGPAVDPRGAG